MALVDHWPLFGLRITTPDLTLRVPDDALLSELTDLAARGIHDPATMPFSVPWTDIEPPEFQRQMVQHHWRGRAELSPAKWDLSFVVIHNDVVVGSQSLHAIDFPALRTAETGSWLGLAYQGQGIGRQMREAILQFAFSHLGANRLTSSAFVDNEPSNRVSVATGYDLNGTMWTKRRGVAAEQHRYLLTRERWESHGQKVSIEVAGFDTCRPLLGQ